MDAGIAAKRDAENQGSRNRQSRNRWEDKAYDVIGHGANSRKIDVTPHGARNNGPAKTGKACPRIAGDETAASDACGMPQTRRKVIEWIFGWRKRHGTMRQTKHRGPLCNLTACNPIRIPKLMAA